MAVLVCAQCPHNLEIVRVVFSVCASCCGSSGLHASRHRRHIALPHVPCRDCSWACHCSTVFAFYPWFHLLSAVQCLVGLACLVPRMGVLRCCENTVRSLHSVLSIVVEANHVVGLPRVSAWCAMRVLEVHQDCCSVSYQIGSWLWCAFAPALPPHLSIFPSPSPTTIHLVCVCLSGAMSPLHAPRR